MNEIPLTLSGGRITPGVVRIEDTVRRPRRSNAVLVRALLDRLEELGLDLAPSYRGIDEQGREIFSYLAGDVPDELDASISDPTLVAAARLIRRFHDATADSPGSRSSARPTASRPAPGIVAAIRSAVAANIERLQDRGRRADTEWWQAQLNWIEESGAVLAASRV